MKARTLFSPAYKILYGFLVLAGVFCDTHPAPAQTQEACPLPDGMTPPPDPPVTAQQVEDGSASLMDFALAARDQFSGAEITSLDQAWYFGCLIRQEGSPWRSGSTYLVQLTPDGRVFVHTKDMALAGRLLKLPVSLAIIRSLGINPADLAGPADAFAALTAAIAGDGGAFDVPDIPGASGYATVYLSPTTRVPIALIAGFDLNESHLAPEEIDYGDPATTAREVVDRESLKSFVTAAGAYVLALQTSGDLAAASKARIALRDENGPWKHGSVYLYVLDLTSNIILFHGANPNRFELRPLAPTVRDAVTGELILPQVIDAAKSSPEGGFVEYYFDDPTDAADSADVPKVGYARRFKGELPRADGSILPIDFIVGSGFYGRAAEVATGPSTVVEATVIGEAVEGLDVEFSRAIAGRGSEYAWSAVTDAAGLFSLTIASADGVSGYYRARATNAGGKVVGRWSSIPLNEGNRQVLELTLGGGVRVVRVQSLAAAEPIAAAKPAIGAGAVPEAGILSPNTPNPFNSATLISYHLSSAGPVKLVIYNVLGQPVRTLVDESRVTGSYRVRWDARDDGGALLSTGVYIARLSYPGGVRTQRLLYLK